MAVIKIEKSAQRSRRPHHPSDEYFQTSRTRDHRLGALAKLHQDISDLLTACCDLLLAYQGNGGSTDGVHFLKVQSLI